MSGQRRVQKPFIKLKKVCLSVKFQRFFNQGKKNVANLTIYTANTFQILNQISLNVINTQKNKQERTE